MIILDQLQKLVLKKLEQFLKAARHEIDNMRGVSANVMCGQEGYFGTSSFKVLVDIDKIIKQQQEEDVIIETATMDDLDKEFTELSDPNDLFIK